MGTSSHLIILISLAIGFLNRPQTAAQPDQFTLLTYFTQPDRIRRCSGHSNTSHTTTQPMVTFTITKSWDNVTLPTRKEVNVTLGPAFDGTVQIGLQINVSAPFYNDPPPPYPVGSTMGLWNYEVVEAFFLGRDDRYLEVEFGPFGHYIVLMLNGAKNCIKHSIPVEYNVTSRSVGDTWTGTAVIPTDYLPAGITKLNCYAIHGLDTEREYSALNPVPNGEFTSPDFHRLEYFKEFNATQLLPGNLDGDFSQLWKDAIANPSC